VLLTDAEFDHLLSDYADLSWSRLETGLPLDLDDRLRVTAFPTGAKAPRYVGRASPPTRPSGRWASAWKTG
jgi:pyrroloquinoline quinone biosynthesis protein B